MAGHILGEAQLIGSPDSSARGSPRCAGPVPAGAIDLAPCVRCCHVPGRPSGCRRFHSLRVNRSSLPRRTLGQRGGGRPDFARQHGAGMLEAYPVDKPGRSHDDFMFFGSRSLYERAGFTEVARRSSTRVVMRMAL